MARVSSLEETIAKVEGILEEIRTRFARVEADLGDIRRETRSTFQWTIGVFVGVLIPMWVSIILAVVFAA